MVGSMTQDKRFSKIAIVGLGLLGGSLAKAIKANGLAEHVIAVSRTSSVLDRALKEGAIDQAELVLGDYLRDVDLVILCTPVQSIIEDISKLPAYIGEHTLVTDIGSTKKHIAASGEEHLKNYIGSHPMAGSEKSGFEYAKADIFQDKTCLITVTPQSPKSLVTQLDDFWVALGARVCYVSPLEHDRIMSRCSHLPHLVAASLVQAMDTQSLEHVAQGFWDTTRVASGSVEMWMDICRTNQAHILTSIDEFSKVMQDLRQYVEHEDYDGLSEWLKEAKHKRDLSL